MQVLQLSRRIKLNLSVRARGGAAACTDRPDPLEEANHMIWRRAPLVLAGLVMPLAANAQVMFDTTRVTCADYLAMSSADPLILCLHKRLVQSENRPRNGRPQRIRA